MSLAYQPPRAHRSIREIPVDQEVRDCAECALTLPAARFYIRNAADPYAVGLDAVLAFRRAARRAGTKPTKAQEEAVRSAALAAPVPPHRRLRLQPRCRSCTRARGHRLRALRHLRRQGYKVTPADSNRYVAQVGSALTPGLLEHCARLGLVIVDDAGAPVLPPGPVEALRVCYSALLSLARPGRLRDDRVALLEAIPGLAEAAGGHALASCAQDVIDCALVREQGPCASDAMNRLLLRTRPRIARKLRAQVRVQVDLGLLTDEEACARFDEGIFLAARKYHPLRATGAAAFATVANTWAGRQAEVRTRGEHWVGQVKDRSTGHWSAPASTLTPTYRSTDEAYEVHAAPFTHGAPALRPDAEGIERDRLGAIQSDVRGALAGLDPASRNVAVRRLLLRESWQIISADTGMTSCEVKRIFAAAQHVLRKVLAVHNEGVIS